MPQPLYTVDQSYYETEARADGTLSIIEICAFIDHGDAGDITDFVSTYMADTTEIAPGVTVQSLLQGSRKRQTAEGILTIQLTDDGDSRQVLMRTFMTLAMMSGRFRPPEELQILMFPDPLDASYPATNPAVPAAWWQALDGVSPWDAAPMLPADGEPWEPDDFAEWVALVSA